MVNVEALSCCTLPDGKRDDRNEAHTVHLSRYRRVIFYRVSPITVEAFLYLSFLFDNHNNKDNRISPLKNHHTPLPVLFLERTRVFTVHSRQNFRDPFRDGPSDRPTDRPTEGPASNAHKLTIVPDIVIMILAIRPSVYPPIHPTCRGVLPCSRVVMDNP